jgi:inosine-uridine nucleoside N-ribohydrolase
MVMSACEVGHEMPLLRGEEPSGKGKELAEYFYGPDGFGEALLEFQRANPDAAMPNVRDESAVDYLIRVCREQPGEITILGLAPLTNLSVAQKKDPNFAKRVKNLVLLGGTYLA